MKLVHVPCGPPANHSELIALKWIRERLNSEQGDDEWVLLTNLAFSAKHHLQSDEIDIVAIGPPGIRVVEVKHWTEDWVKKNRNSVIEEAERLTLKAKKIAGKLRKHVPHVPMVKGVFLVTQRASMVATIKRRGPVRGIPFFNHKTCGTAIGLFAKKVLSQEEIKKLSTILESRSSVAVDGSLKRMAGYSNLKLLTPPDRRFHRIYKAIHTSRRNRVKLHLYDLSANDNVKALQKAEREWKSLNRLQRYEWAPRIIDSFQDAPGYPGEIKFFTIADPLAHHIAQRSKDDLWDNRARMDFALRTVQALRQLHEDHPGDEQPMVHRNLSPSTILVKHDNSPIFTGFEQARIPTDVTLASLTSDQEWVDEVAPEVRNQGLGAADHRSDVYSLCASLSTLFHEENYENDSEILAILSSGMEHKPQNRSSLIELQNRLSARLGESVPPTPPPSARFWTEDQIVPFRDNSYRIVSSLGSGGVGTAYKVVKLDRDTNEELGTYVAKVVRDRNLGQRVLRSYEFAHSHLRHNALSIIFEVAREWRDNTFIALMTWVEGEPLGEYSGQVSLLADDLQQESGETLALGWLRDACQGLDVLHRNGMIHGDVSPRNMIVSGTNLVLTDYDCVTKIGTPASSPGTVMYCSPSFQTGIDAAPSDDMYALAASFFHVLFEREPFRHDKDWAKERGLNWKDLNLLDYSNLREFLDRATHPNPVERFKNAAEALSSLADSLHTAKSANNFEEKEAEGNTLRGTIRTIAGRTRDGFTFAISSVMHAGAIIVNSAALLYFSSADIFRRKDPDS